MGIVTLALSTKYPLKIQGKSQIKDATLVKHISFLIKDVTIRTLRVTQRNPAELQQKNVVSKQTR